MTDVTSEVTSQTCDSCGNICWMMWSKQHNSIIDLQRRPSGLPWFNRTWSAEVRRGLCGCCLVLDDRLREIGKLRMIAQRLPWSPIQICDIDTRILEFLSGSIRESAINSMLKKIALYVTLARRGQMRPLTWYWDRSDNTGGLYTRRDLLEKVITFLISCPQRHGRDLEHQYGPSGFDFKWQSNDLPWDEDRHGGHSRYATEPLSMRLIRSNDLPFDWGFDTRMHLGFLYGTDNRYAHAQSLRRHNLPRESSVRTGPSRYFSV